jgi:predicted CoA-binding protein
MKTLVLGASNNTHRYSYLATVELLEHGHEVIPVGIKKASINNIPITGVYPENEDIHTLAMYLSAENQEKYYDSILNNPPKRVIFNPGTHNPVLENKLKNIGVDVLHSCVLIMLSNNQY